MKVMKIKYELFPTLCLMQYKSRLLDKIEIYKDYVPMRELLKDYSLEQVKSSVNSIKVEEGYITIPDYDNDSKILRLLQYGGASMRAMNLLSKVASEVSE